MIWAILFRDDPAKAHLRQTHGAAHQEWLRTILPRLVAAGGLREAPETAPLGGLWLLEAESRAEVEALIAGDPYRQAGLRASVEILHWTKAVWEHDWRL